MKKMVKAAATICLVLGVTLAFAGESGATSYSFASNDGSGTQNDLNDLDHYKLYVWGIDPTSVLSTIASKNETIIGAKINFTNISNWTNESNDILKVYLVDNPKVVDKTNNGIDVWSATDNQNTSGVLNELTDPRFVNPTNTNYRFSAITSLWTWTDVVDGLKHTSPSGKLNSYGHDLEYIFDNSEFTKLLDYLSSTNTSSTARCNYATFGLGFDPDCHYNNAGITFTLLTETKTPPVPEPGTIVLLGSGLLGLGLYSRRRAKKM